MPTIIDLKLGEKAIVKELIHSPISNRMAAMGIVEGVEITVSFSAPLGDPLAVELNGTLLCLRKDEARLVEIRKVD